MFADASRCGLISKPRWLRERSLSASPITSLSGMHPLPKMTYSAFREQWERAGWKSRWRRRRRRRAAVSCKMQIGIRCRNGRSSTDVWSAVMDPGERACTYIHKQTHTHLYICLCNIRQGRPSGLRRNYGGWLHRGCHFHHRHHRRQRVSWPVTGDSYVVDITIMECVRLPLCLSPYPNRGRTSASRGSALLSVPVSYNRPSLPPSHDFLP